MMIGRRTITVACALALAVFGTAGGTLDDDDSTDAVVVAAVEQLELTGQPVFVSDEDIPDELARGGEVEIVDGELVAVRSSSCSSGISATAWIGVWATSTNYGCYYMAGWGGSKYYSWNVPLWTAGGSVCLNVLGFVRTGPNSSAAAWGYAGCGSSGGRSIDWQNTAGYPSVQGMANRAPVAGVTYSWR